MAFVIAAYTSFSSGSNLDLVTNFFRGIGSCYDCKMFSRNFQDKFDYCILVVFCWILKFTA